jgi:hypothetical protein
MPTLKGDDGTPSEFSPSAPFGVWGDSAAGVVGLSAQDIGVIGVSNGIGIMGLGGGDSGFFFGNVRVMGSVTRGGGGSRSTTQSIRQINISAIRSLNRQR